MADDPLPPTDDVVRLYAEGQSMYDIAMTLGSREWIVKNVLLLAGVQIRGRGGIMGKKRKKFYRD